MKINKIMMGMPIIVEIVGNDQKIASTIENVFEYFEYIDQKFSVYKPDSEISKINRGEIMTDGFSSDMKEILRLAQITKEETYGYFDINRNGKIDPSGIVKGWAIHNAGKIIKKFGYTNFYINAGGDIEVSGLNEQNKKWKVGIVNPFDQKTSIKTLYLTDCGVATSGNYERGNHIYNPLEQSQNEIVSFTIIGPNVFEADRYATPAFAIGYRGIEFIERQKDLFGYIIDNKGIATMTSGFEQYINE